MSEVTTYSSATSLVPHSMDEAMRLAGFMARARTVPKHLQDSPGDCLMVIEQAMRWGMSPFAVAQATSVISGKLMYEGKLVAAAVETSGAIVGHIDYDFAGEGEGRSITVSATRRGETNPRTVTVTFKEARTNNEMWKRQPDQQLTYHGIRVWARRWTPAVILGVYSREEMGPIIEGEAIENTASDAREQLNREVPLKAAAAPMPRAARVAERAPAYEGPPQPGASKAPMAARSDADWKVWLDKMRAAGDVLYRREEFVEMANRASIGDAIANGPPWVRAEISAYLAEGYARFPEEELTDDELPEVKIAGEEKVAAG